MPKIGIKFPETQRPLFESCQLTGFAWSAQKLQIPLADAAAGYAWGWLENLALSGVKIIPLGQTEGQQILKELLEQIPTVVASGLEISDEDIGLSCPAQAIASSLHETQYTRIYRS